MFQRNKAENCIVDARTKGHRCIVSSESKAVIVRNSTAKMGDSEQLLQV
jgi:hypothetical protein